RAIEIICNNVHMIECMNFHEINPAISSRPSALGGLHFGMRILSGNCFTDKRITQCRYLMPQLHHWP
ncbi:MAG: hypothetical protein KDE63_00005, partial [Novosphingobium sp.]|nr:hypothetical protein [Novosphingobium sp.]